MEKQRKDKNKPSLNREFCEVTRKDDCHATCKVADSSSLYVTLLLSLKLHIFEYMNQLGF